MLDVFRLLVVKGNPVQIVPEINGHSLIDLVAAYESQHGYDTPGAYGGLIPEWFNFGDLGAHFLGENEKQWPHPGSAWVLGCSCGEVGCWPLEVKVDLTSDTVTWTRFRQEHRPEWDYCGLGPFRFERQAYEDAVGEAVSILSGGSGN